MSSKSSLFISWKTVLLICFCLIIQVCRGQSLTLSIQASNPTCDFANGYILSSGSGGVEPYVFSCTGFPSQNTGLFTQLSAGSYTITLSDGAGARTSQNINLTTNFRHPNAPMVSTSVPPTGCLSNGSLMISTTGGTAPYQYSIDGSNFLNTSNFLNLYPGTYNLYVKDANGCTVSSRYNLQDNCGFVSSPSATASSCNNDGTITMTPIGSGTYEYSKDGGRTFQVNPVFTSLAGGGYTIVVRDINSMQDSRISVSVPKVCPLDISSSSTEAGCSGNSGSITMSVVNAAAPFFYWIDNGSVIQSAQPTNTFTQLSPGTHTINVKTLSGLNASQQVIVSGTPVPTITATATYNGCGPNGGEIQASANGGSLPYSYVLDNGLSQSSGNFNGLSGGSYMLSVSDRNGCIAKENVSITPTTGPKLTTLATFIGCSANGGSISATASGGAIPYLYSLNSGLPQTDGNFSSLPGGTYQVRVTDQNGCSSDNSVAIIPTLGPSLTLLTTKTQCSSLTGSITVSVAGGKEPFKFQLGGNPEQMSGVFQKLGSGIYNIKVTDQNGCVAEDSATVETEVAPTLSITEVNSSCAGNDGKIFSESSGGVTPIKFLLDETISQPGGFFDSVANGNHMISVSDANGCSTTKAVNVGINNDVIVNAGEDKSICKGDSTTLVGSSNANIKWAPAGSLSDANNSKTIAKPEISTTYSLTATEGVCSAIDSVKISILPLPIAYAGNDTTVCYGNSAELHGSGGVSYTWTPSNNLNNDHSSSPIVSNLLTSQTYQLSVKDLNGCVSLTPDEVSINVTPPLKVSAGNDTSIITSIPFQLHATDVDGIGFTKYLWTPSLGLNNSMIQDPTAILTKEQTYILTASTAQGCAGTDSLNIRVFDEANIYVPNAFTPNGDGINDFLKVIAVGIQQFRFFTIYNRFGEKVFSTNNASVGWDGRIGGITQNTGGFVWNAEGINYKGEMIKRQGTTVLIR